MIITVNITLKGRISMRTSHFLPFKSCDINIIMTIDNIFRFIVMKECLLLKPWWLKWLTKVLPKAHFETCKFQLLALMDISLINMQRWRTFHKDCHFYMYFNVYWTFTSPGFFEESLLRKLYCHTIVAVLLRLVFNEKLHVIWHEKWHSKMFCK